MAGRMKSVSYTFLLFLVLINFVRSSELTNMIDEDVLTTKAYVFWPNATIPFYIDTEHFDKEQSISIMTALALFAFKTCLKFVPVMAKPENTDHVLLLENPTGVRKCTINTEPLSIEEPHRVTLGYDCLKSPEIDMMIMKALGFPFEHNRAVRDLYIEIQPENVEPGFLDLYTRDLRLPLELRAIPFDPNSVMHFGQRDFSKNGHRTIIFKNRSLRQERFGLSPLDLRKIDVVYGPECKTRDRQEKIELCQNYPGVARRKRDTTDSPKSLRVNPDITPPADVGNSTASGNHTVEDLHDSLVEDLGIQKEVYELVDQVNKIAGVALQKAKDDKCGNETKQALRALSGQISQTKIKIVDIIGDIAQYANQLVNESTKNLTEFCADDKMVSDYVLRSSCPFFNPDRCPKNYRSTKSGPVKYSTQHRPIYIQSTKPQGTAKKNIYMNWLRSENSTEVPEGSVTGDASTPLEPKEDAAKGNLRSGNTRLPHLDKSMYVPNYRASNDSANASNQLKKDRKKRDTSKDTVVVKTTTNKAKDTKAEVKVSKVKKHEKKLKSAKRRFESQRFRPQKGEYERGLQEKEWDNSGVTAEKMSYNTRTTGQNKESVGKGNKFTHIKFTQNVMTFGKEIHAANRDTEITEDGIDTRPKRAGPSKKRFRRGKDGQDGQDGNGGKGGNGGGKGGNGGGNGGNSGGKGGNGNDGKGGKGGEGGGGGGGGVGSGGNGGGGGGHGGNNGKGGQNGGGGGGGGKGGKGGRRGENGANGERGGRVNG